MSTFLHAYEKRYDIWMDQQRQETLEMIKAYFTTSLSWPILSKENPGAIYHRPDLLPWCIISPRKCWRKGNALYYLFQTLIDQEKRYFHIQKMRLAFIFFIYKLCRYLQHITWCWFPKRIPSHTFSTSLSKWAINKVGSPTLAIWHWVLIVECNYKSSTRNLLTIPVPDDSPLATDLPDADVMTIVAQKDGKTTLMMLSKKTAW